MAEASNFLSTKRIALVTGANKGIGLEICRQLASKGITVVLTARDEKKGVDAVENLILKDFGLSDNVIFHKLDVMDPSSIAATVEFVKTRFGKLDILVNNAAIIGVAIVGPDKGGRGVSKPKHIVNNAAIIGVAIVDPDALITSARNGAGFINWHKVSTQNYDLAEECIKINYYGAKRLIEASISLLQSSDWARIVNVSSLTGKLKFVCNEWAQSVLGDGDSLTEDRVDEVLSKFLKDFKGDMLETRGWPTYLSAYTLAKAAMNAYTRILAKKHPNFIVNSVCPGYVRTDLNCNTGTLTPEEGAESPVWLALLPEGGPTGLFFSRKVVSPF